MTKAVIFDFDGTLADTFDLFLSIARELFDVEQELTDSFVEELRGMERDEILNALDISKFQALWYYRKGRSMFADRLDEARLFEGVRDALDVLASEYQLGIVTNNEVELVETFLDDAGIRVFDFVSHSMWLESKSRALSRAVDDRCRCAPDEVVYVGDQSSDIDAAHDAGCKMIAVTWGYHKRSYLEQGDADRLVDSPEGLLDAVQSL